MDVEELRQSMKAILDTGNDVAILSYLGIDKADIPEAIKTLQRLGESRGKLRVGEGSNGGILLLREFLHRHVKPYGFSHFLHLGLKSSEVPRLEWASFRRSSKANGKDEQWQ